MFLTGFGKNKFPFFKKNYSYNIKGKKQASYCSFAA
jgi:hypothetical protein